jgi:hypothetical protein
VWGFLTLWIDVCRWHTEHRGVWALLDMHIYTYEQRFILWWAVGVVCCLLFCGAAYSHATEGRWPRSSASTVRPYFVSCFLSLSPSLTSIINHFHITHHSHRLSSLFVTITLHRHNQQNLTFLIVAAINTLLPLSPHRLSPRHHHQFPLLDRCIRKAALISDMLGSDTTSYRHVGYQRERSSAHSCGTKSCFQYGRGKRFRI